LGAPASGIRNGQARTSINENGLAMLGYVVALALTVAFVQPNVILVLADDLSESDLSGYGGKVAETPQLDRMAHDGIGFTRYYAAVPICSPSRCGLLTGEHPGRWRITSFLQTRAGNKVCGQADFLDSKAPTFANLSRNA
jgi:arylsulfatase A-like enzyme